MIAGFDTERHESPQQNAPATDVNRRHICERWLKDRKGRQVSGGDIAQKIVIPLAMENENGGGGIRTPVPRCFKTSLYMLSRLIVFSPRQVPNDRLLVRLFRSVLASPARTTGLASLLCDALTQPTGKVRQDGLPN